MRIKMRLLKLSILLWLPLAIHAQCIPALNAVTGTLSGCKPTGSGGAATPNYSQSFTAQTSVTINHALNSTAVLMSCYDGTTGNQVVPGIVDIVDVNNIAVTFTQAQTGKCVVNSTGGGSRPGGISAPGGSNGMIQYNNSNTLDGFQPAGDVSFSVPNFTVIGLNGTLLSSLATGPLWVTTTTGAITSASIANLLSVFTGVKDTTTFLRGDGSFAAPTINLTVGTGLQLVDNEISFAPGQLYYIPGSASLTFGTVATNACGEQSFTVTGAATNDVLLVGYPSGLNANLSAVTRVTAANTVTVRLCNPTGSGIAVTAGLTFSVAVGKSI